MQLLESAHGRLVHDAKYSPYCSTDRRGKACAIALGQGNNRLESDPPVIAPQPSNSKMLVIAW